MRSTLQLGQIAAIRIGVTSRAACHDGWLDLAANWRTARRRAQSSQSAPSVKEMVECAARFNLAK